MNRSELKLNAKNVLKKNYSSAILFCFVYHTVTGRLGAEISFILTILFYRPSDPDLNIEKIGFSENVISEDILYYISIAASVLLLAVFAVFFVGPLSVAKANFFIKARKDSFKASYAFNIFREGRYEQVLKIMLARNIILFAGYLLIIPGIYLSYTFRFVPYIAAENPDIGWKEESYNGEVQDGWFVDLDEKRIHTLFKLVPWEWLLADPFGQKLRDEVMNDRLTVIEPAWKMLAANKRLLATMWELNPYHPSLLPTFTTAAPLAGKAYVRKPVWGREGQNVTIFAADGSVAEEVGGAYGDNQYVYQEKAQLMEADGNYAVIGSWLIDGESAGIGIRESTHVITDNMGRFVPHMFA